jgi:hypothetical protein
MLVLLMSAVPLPLPGMLTVSMATGSQGLDKRGVLVTSLGAAEDAATGHCIRSFIAQKPIQVFGWRPDHPTCPPTARAIRPLSEDAERLNTQTVTLRAPPCQAPASD